MTWVFTVPGEPVAAARARHRIVTPAGGRPFTSTYSPQSNVQYAERVRYAFREAFPDYEVIERGVPIGLAVTFIFPRPASHFGTGKNASRLKESAPYWHTKRPDVDNLIKLVKDSLKGEAWHDDAQVIGYGRDTFKRYVGATPGEVPRTVVQWWEATR